MSIPVLSALIGIEPSDVTQSAITSAPTSCAAAQIASPACSAPVDVSAFTKATTLGSSRRMKSRASSSLKVSPQGFSKRTSCAPWRLPISLMRSQKYPLANTANFFPGSTKFATEASIPALPVPEITIVTPSVVPYGIFSSCSISPIIWKKYGSRWPTTGLPSASYTRGCTMLGPGPNK